VKLLKLKAGGKKFTVLIYHTHKWWAQRLGTIFRAAILGATAPKGTSIMDLFYQSVRLPGVVIYDPFMGSGTTAGEAHKLGCTVIARDINPVAYRAACTALGPMNRRELILLFQQLCKSASEDLRSLYKGTDSIGHACDVLYYFWVKVLPCPSCNKPVDLFSKYIFAQHAYISQDPTVQVVCPGCNAVFASTYEKKSVTCIKCKLTFNPHEGPAKRTTAICGHCGNEFPMAKTARSAGHPPLHRMYAKLVLRLNGTKEYLPITSEDIALYEAARKQLQALNPLLPKIPIKDGYNTHQILNYGYQYWYELFNDRQLLALTLLAKAISELRPCAEKDAFINLFSGTLEFNNMFASYKGEGTGAVRHMFSHHILKPERTPIEANIWGTPKSSGAFSTLFQSRLLRAIDYREAPFEIAVDRTTKRKKGSKVYGISAPIGTEIVNAYPTSGLRPGNVYLSSGSSTKIDIPEGIVDVVVTDPPFFDNVHYSELADFFYVWQQLYFNGKKEQPTECTTRHKEEVQDADAGEFSNKLRDVFIECRRVLREEGLLVFSYHHSREEGWIAVAKAVLEAGFSFVQSQPVKSEMSVAAPKSQAKEPIDLDILLVCRKKMSDERKKLDISSASTVANSITDDKVSRFNKVGRKLSKNDVRIILLSQILVELSAGRKADEVQIAFEKLLPSTRAKVDALWEKQHIDPDKKVGSKGIVQLSLFGSE
jgi:putative DNA methylase